MSPTSRSIAHVLASALNGRGERLLRGGEIRQAIQDFARAADADSGSALSFANLSRAYLAANDVKTALEASNEALRLDPRNPEFRADRAALHIRRREYPEAMGEAWAALEMDEGNRTAFVALTTALDELGRSGESDSLWAARLTHHPEDEPLSGQRLRRRGRRRG